MTYLTRDIQYHIDCLIRARRIFSAGDVRARLSRPALSRLRAQPNAIGQVFKTYSESKRIRLAGTDRATHAKSKGHLVRTWIGA